MLEESTNVAVLLNPSSIVIESSASLEAEIDYKSGIQSATLLDESASRCLSAALRVLYLVLSLYISAPTVDCSDFFA